MFVFIRWLEMAFEDIPASAKFYGDLFGWLSPGTRRWTIR